MPRIAYRLWLRPDAHGIETYVRYHLDPFDGLYDLIRGAGIRRYTIWLDGTDLFLTREGETPEKGETLDLDNPVHKAWSDTMRPLFQDRVKAEGPGRPALVHAFRPDAEPGPPEGQMTYRADLVPGDVAREAVRGAFERRADALAGALDAAGVRRAWTWVEDGSAWAYLEAEALDPAEAALARDPAWRELWASLAPSLAGPTARDGWRRTREVFRCD